MKRKIPVLLMSFLAFGLFGAIGTAKTNVETKTSTKLVMAEEDVTPVELTVTTWAESFYGDIFAHFYFEWDESLSLNLINDAKTYTVNGVEKNWFDWVDKNEANPGHKVNLMVGDKGTQPVYVLCFFNAEGKLIAQGTYVNYIAAPTNVKIVDNATLTFAPNEIADKHSLQYLEGIDGEVVAATEDNVTSGYALRNDLDAGVYRIRVRAHYGDKVSEWALADTTYTIAHEGATQLSVPTNVKLNNGVLTFNGVANATRYDVGYVKDGGTVKTESANNTTYILNDDGLTAGEYVIKVRAIGNQEEWTNSEWAEAEGKFVVESKVANVTLNLINKYNDHYGRFTYTIDQQDVTLKGKKAQDTKINGVQAIMFEYLNDHEFNAYITDSNYQESEYKFEWFENGNLVAQGTYVNEVVLPSEPVKLKAPEGLVINAGEKTLAFASVSNASGYHVEYRQNDEVKYDHDIANGGLLNPDNNFAAGTYDIWVKSVGDGEHYLDSDYVFAGQFVIIVESNPHVEAEAFVQEWLSLRNAEGSICDQVKGEATALKEMIAKYDALSPEVKAIVDESLDYEGNTIQNSVEYLRSFLGLDEAPSADQSVGGLLLTAVKDNTGTIAIVLALIIGTFVGYFVLRNKKRLVK